MLRSVKFTEQEIAVMSLKTDILTELENNTEAYLSGQYLAEKFGVSRNAVWKAVNQLKADGYIIDSVQNKGYSMSSASDVLSADKIKDKMTSDLAKEIKIFIFDSIDSTNNEAKRMVADGFRQFGLIISNEQTNGRGRLGRNFYSPKNTGIYMSFVFHPNAEISSAVSVTTAASVAVVRAVEKLTNIKPQIKWVNDVYINSKKICGILTEAITDFESGLTQSVIVGIGINLTTGDFPAEISDKATSINFSGLSRNDLIAAVSDEMANICSDINNHSYIDDYRSHSLIIGKRIDYYKNNIKFSGLAIDIDDNGGLAVRTDNGPIEILHSGEITVRLSDR